MGGYQTSFNFNLTDVLQAQGDHIAACIDYVRRNGFTTIDPKPDAEEWWVQEVIAHPGARRLTQSYSSGCGAHEPARRRTSGSHPGASTPQDRLDLREISVDIGQLSTQAGDLAEQLLATVARQATHRRAPAQALECLRT